MARRRHKDSFWLSYSDLMTSLFFIMLVLFVVGIAKVQVTNTKLKGIWAKTGQLGTENKQLKDSIAMIRHAKDSILVEKTRLEGILNLEAYFKELSNSTVLQFIPERKMFVAKDFEGKEIFNPNSDAIKPEFYNLVDRVGTSLQEVVKNLHKKNPNLRFQLVIEGYAAIPWKELQTHSYNPDNEWIYKLSYNRALALYNRWRSRGINLRPYNTEIIIAGSGFNGINRDKIVEENNKRFVIQIIPKISKP